MYVYSFKVQFSRFVKRAEPAWKPRGKAVSCSCPGQVPAVSPVPLLWINRLGHSLRGLIPRKSKVLEAQAFVTAAGKGMVTLHCWLGLSCVRAHVCCPSANGPHCPAISHLTAGPRAEAGGTSSFLAKANREVSREIGEQRHQALLGVARALLTSNM